MSYTPQEEHVYGDWQDQIKDMVEEEETNLRVDREVQELQIARDKANVERKKGNIDRANHIEASASAWVLSMRELSKTMERLA